jgi:hypothetical protein
LNHTLRVPDLAAAVARLLDETPRPTKTPPV